MARSSGWREVKFVGGRLDGQARMVTVTSSLELAAEIRMDAQAGQREVYELHTDEVLTVGSRKVYRNPRYVLRE